MKIEWYQNKTLPEVQYIATPKNIPMAKMMSENDSPTLIEFDKTRLNSKGLTIEQQYSHKINKAKYLWFVLRGYSSEQIVEKLGGKYPFKIKILVS